MQKENMRKSQNEILFIFFLLLITPTFCGQNNSKGICYVKKDTVLGDTNSDNCIDSIVVYLEDAGSNIKVELFLLEPSGAYTKRTKEWFSASRYVDLKVGKGFLIYTSAYGRSHLDYATMIYKYVKQFDDWFLYGFLKSEMNAYNQLCDWEEPTLQGTNIASTQAFGVEEVSDAFYNILIDQSGISDHFFNDYSKYCEEYRTKNYAEAVNHNTIRTLDYLNNVEINNRTLQAYNDIAFFLLEAGNSQQAIYILENVLSKFPNRVVAYLNLGDAYYGNDEEIKAVEMYQKYLGLMESEGKGALIPKRVWERVK